MDTTRTKSQLVAADINGLMRARNPLIWIVTREEARVERYVIEAAAAASYVPRCWDVAQGVTAIGGRPVAFMPETQDAGAALALIGQRANMPERNQAANQQDRGKPERGAWIMRDLAPWLGAGLPCAQTVRQLRNLARSLPTTARDSAQSIIVLTPSAEVPPELAGHATVIQWPLPDRAEIAAILDAAIASLPEDMRADAAPNGTREAAIDAAVGLTGEEAQACIARSLVTTRRIDPTTIAQEKRRVVAREGVLEWFDPLPGGLDAVGGLDVLKSYLQSRKAAYSPAARAYGLPAPRGTLLAGVPGCGKSLSAKAVATAWACPLLRFDLGAVKSKFVGESEAMIRKAFDVIAAIGRCVVWFDEIEKALAGATDGAADGGVAKDQLGAILNWMQERTGEAYIIATANDVAGLPPELMRRFDVSWFVDLPNHNERAEIVQAALRAHGRFNGTTVDINADEVAERSEGFTGAEVAGLVPSALFLGFNDGAREITTADLLAVARDVVPLSKTASEKIEALRRWADQGRARRATTATNAAQTGPQGSGRVLDI